MTSSISRGGAPNDGTMSTAIPLQSVGRKPLNPSQSVDTFNTGIFSRSSAERYEALPGATHDEESGLIQPHRKKPDQKQVFYHRDILKRPFSGQRDDRFINPKDGRPKALVVQAAEQVLAQSSGATWQRTAVQNKSPWMFRLSCWAFGDLAIVKWIPACALLTVVLVSPLPVTTTIKNNGFYEPLSYKDWQYPYDARNRYENAPSREHKDGIPQPSKRPLIGKIERFSEPGWLCLANDMKTIKVADWREKHGYGVTLDYIMISYTGVQFATGLDKPMQDRVALHRIGQNAARLAGVEAYWLDFECLGPDEEHEENAWRISDVVRGAFRMIIAIGGPVDAVEEDQLPYNLVRAWGNRVWTLPELLLTPGHNDLWIYTINRNLDPTTQLDQCLNTLPKQITLRNFSRYWEDHEIIAQLIDHYESSVILSPLELITTALKCLEVRHITQHLPGDLSYSLMGLLRRRPNAQKSDSGFQAFARLSLANDSNMLLERLICLLPQSPYAPWYSFHDHWDASLWDIYPRTQVCGIGHNDTVILDGARAATIRWKSFKKVLIRGNDTLKRRLARIALSMGGVLFFTAVITLAVSGIVKHSSNYSASSSAVTTPLNVFGGILMAIALSIILASPLLIKWLYLGKVWSAQPWFFGIEGYMSLSAIEEHIFGADLGRLTWSTTSSSLSRHSYLNEQNYEDFCEGKDPSTYPDVAARIQQAAQGGDEKQREKIFTLGDGGEDGDEGVLEDESGGEG
ncbi:MAG: hypothetical protein Q9170_004829 [Blastenia crenularia]